MARTLRARWAMETATHWWLDEGGEACPDCHESYAYEMEVRCAACDGPLCPLCVVIVRETLRLCRSCADEDASEEDATETATAETGEG